MGSLPINTHVTVLTRRSLQRMADNRDMTQSRVPPGRTLLSLVDIELLRMEGRIALDDDRFTAHLLQLIEPAGVPYLQRLDHLRVYAQEDILTLQMVLHLAH